MPICTSCTEYMSYLYTVYKSADNLRLEQCHKCREFADPYVEHDTLIIILDLILLKRGVFRHLLFNRGYAPRRMIENDARSSAPPSLSSPSSPSKDESKADSREVIRLSREKRRWEVIVKLGAALIFVDAFIRWSHLRNSDTQSTVDSASLSEVDIRPFLRIVAACTIETAAFHSGITLAAASALWFITALNSFRSRPILSPQSPGVRSEFRLSHVPLTLLYSSLTKLFLLLVLTLWKPSRTNPQKHDFDFASNNGTLGQVFRSELVQSALELLDDDKLDREWIIRNVLGGMAAGFGLRVVMDIHPFFTTCIVLFGWAVKTFVANLLSPWVSSTGEQVGEVFLAYSIP